MCRGCLSRILHAWAKRAHPDLLASLHSQSPPAQQCGVCHPCSGQPILLLCRLPSAEQNLLKDKLMNVVANAVYYNPVLALQHLQQQGRLQHFFATWFQVRVLSMQRLAD